MTMHKITLNDLKKDVFKNLKITLEYEGDTVSVHWFSTWAEELLRIIIEMEKRMYKMEMKIAEIDKRTAGSVVYG